MISTIVYQNQGQMSRQNVSYIVPFVPYVKIIVDLVIKAYLKKAKTLDEQMFVCYTIIGLI